MKCRKTHAYGLVMPKVRRYRDGIVIYRGCFLAGGVTVIGIGHVIHGKDRKGRCTYWWKGEYRNGFLEWSGEGL